MTSPSAAYLTEISNYAQPTAPAPSLPADAPNDLPIIPGDETHAPQADTPSNYIPGLVTLGSTYDVLNGKYADARSASQQVVDWNKSKVTVLYFTY